MEIKKFPIAGLIEFVPRVFADDRGVFFETFSARLMAQAGADAQWVQDNQSNSKKGVLRGLHFQRPPHARCLSCARHERSSFSAQFLLSLTKPFSPTFYLCPNGSKAIPPRRPD